MSALGILALGAVTLFLFNAVLKLRRDRKSQQSREVQRELRAHLNGDKRASRESSRERSSEDARISQLAAAVKKAEQESQRLAAALEALQEANADPVFKVDRKDRRKKVERSQPKSDVAPAVFRSGRTGLRVDHLH